MRKIVEYASKFLYFLQIIILLCCSTLQALKIDRVILSSDANAHYLQFWPLVARAWHDLIGVRPTLILIADDTIKVDESVGDVIRLKPIPDVSTATYAQAVRLLAPAYFENEVCIISDIDMLPLSKEYFVDTVKDIPDDMFVVYRDTAYGNIKRYPMCYNAGKGHLFKTIFKLKAIKDIPKKVRQWALKKKLQGKNWGWHTDEVALYTCLHKWKHFKTKCALLGSKEVGFQRIDRTDWQFDVEKLRNNEYIDAHMPRPFQAYVAQIKKLADNLGLEIS